MKCEICKTELGKTFLGKILGTIIKDAKGKSHTVCCECQKKYSSKKELLERIA